MKMARSRIYSAVLTFFAVFLLSGLASGLELGENCVTPNKAKGTCIEINDCPSLAEASKVKPLPQATLDLLRKSQCGFQGRNPLACCPSTTPSPPVENTEDVSNHPNIRLLKQEMCGPVTEDKIINGIRAKLNELPWMALIAYTVRSGSPFRCGGTIISDRYVLTAAHCVKLLPSSMKPISVRLGEHDIDSDKDCEEVDPGDPTSQVCAPAPQDIPIEQVIAHANYVGKPTLQNDVALIRLTRPADFTPDSVRPVCLPTGLPQQTLNLDGKKVIVSGWGVTETGQTSKVLLKVFVPVNSYEVCSAAYKGTVGISSISQLCAGGIKDGGDSCSGDSGGPLTSFGAILGSTRNVQHGIVSFGPRNCGSAGQPGVYTRVGHFMKWILDNMKD